MQPEVINMIAQFLQRCDLKGSEVPQWQTCMQALETAMQETRTVTERSQETPYDKS